MNKIILTFMKPEQCLQWLQKPYMNPFTHQEISDDSQYKNLEQKCQPYLEFNILDQTKLEIYPFPVTGFLTTFFSLIYVLRLKKFCHPFEVLYSSHTEQHDPFVNNFDFSFRWVQEGTGWKLLPPLNFLQHMREALEGCSHRFVGIFITVIGDKKEQKEQKDRKNKGEKEKKDRKNKGEKERSIWANLLLYDKIDHEWERFQPYGSPSDFNGRDLDLALIDMLRKFTTDGKDKNKQIIRVKNYYISDGDCPLNASTHRSPLCSIWNMWFLKYRLDHPELLREDALNHALVHLNINKRNIQSFEHFSKKYLQYLRSVLEGFKSRRIPEDHMMDDFLARYVLVALS